MPNSLSDLAGMTAAPLEEVALAIASEFRTVDVAGAHANLDLLAEGMEDLAALPPEARAQGLLHRLVEDRGLVATSCGCPDGLMLDQVLDLRRGHQLALCIVHVAVARRLGFELHVAGSGGTVLVGDPGTRPALLIDPVPGGRRLPQDMHWLCPHVVGSTLLTHLIERFTARGAVGDAIRAAELRLLFPLAADTRDRHEIELRKLRARLN
jgi:regulator of sirC expression with transglutaminase-like and TPR domain